jgi:spore coat protein U-like protein
MRKLQAMMLGVSVVAAGLAQSATTTTTFPVTATLAATCSATAANVAFGAYTPGGGTLTANANISVKCTKSTAYTVALNKGSSTGGTLAQRLMTGTPATNTLQYNLYTAASLATIFGDGTGGTGTVAGTGAGVATPTTVTVYGQLPDNATNQAAVPGAYSDTITVTVTY